jgi:hypothetical protein
VSIFSGRRYPKDVILWAVRWYCRYGVSYRDLEQMPPSAACRLITLRSIGGCSATHPSWTSGPAGTAGSASGQRNCGGSRRSPRPGQGSYPC